MIEVCDKKTLEIFDVFSITYKNGYPYFLIYKDNQWITRSAKHFRPLNDEEYGFYENYQCLNTGICQPKN
jgi:hypothetical protein